MIAMSEETTKTLSKTIAFEKSGETLTLTATLVNVSPQNTDSIQDMLSSMFSELLSELG